MTESRTVFGSLSDIKVLDLTQMLAGPYGTMMLADHGAEVIKVEPPKGDMTRASGPFHTDDDQRSHGGYFQSVNRNKKSICLDLKSEEGKAALRELVKSADALIENFRHGVMDRLGLSYEELAKLNPRLVYGSLRGFGDERTGRSPYVDWPAFDVVAQAMGGMMGITGPDHETPTKVGPGIGDIVPGMMLAFGVLSAIHHARRTGEGQFVDVSMVDGVLATCERMIYQHTIQKTVPGPEGNHHPFICPFGMYPAKDGHVTLAAPQDAFFAILCEELGAQHLPQDARFKTAMDRTRNKGALNELISSLTANFSKAQLTEMLGGKMPFGPVFDMADVSADAHFQTREMLVELDQPGSANKTQVAGVPIKMTKTPGAVRRRSPHLGENMIEVLTEAGFSQNDISALQSVGAPQTKKI